MVFDWIQMPGTPLNKLSMDGFKLLIQTLNSVENEEFFYLKHHGVNESKRHIRGLFNWN